MRFGIEFIGMLLVLLAGIAASSAQSGNRIFRCIGADGELVFRDQPCSRAGLADVRARKPALFQTQKKTELTQSRCLFASKPLVLEDPAFEHTQLRLVVDIDAEGPFLNIVSTGSYVLEIAELVEAPEIAEASDRAIPGADPETASQVLLEADLIAKPAVARVITGRRDAAATFSSHVSSQGLRMSDGTFHEAEWRMGERTLGFGRSRMTRLLTALSRDQVSLVVWFEGLAHPVQSSSIPAEEFRLAVDNVRRCWKTQAPRAE